MKCPSCGASKTTVINKLYSSNDEAYRKRACNECGHIFYTTEFEIDVTPQFKKEWDKLQQADVREKLTMVTRHFGYRCEHISRPKEYVYAVYSIEDTLPDGTVKPNSPARGFFSNAHLASVECEYLETFVK